MSFCGLHRQTLAVAPSIRRTGVELYRSGKAAYATVHTTPAAHTKTILKAEDRIHFAFGSHSWVSFQHRSLLRSILREASYLPDPNARVHIQQRAIDYSRKRAFRAWERRDDPKFAERNWRQLANDRQELRRLQRANAGERKPLLRLLFRTYGRVGARRHELLQPLIPTRDGEAIYRLMVEKPPPATEPDVNWDGDGDGDDGFQSSDAPMPEKDNVLSTAQHNQHNSLPTLTPQLYALAKSQKEDQPPVLTRKNPRNLQPTIPALNARMRPMPKKRVANMHQKWYAYLLNCILPPLPTKEWEQLRDWAQGKNLPVINVPRRQTRAEQSFRHFGRYSALEAIVRQGRIDKNVYGNREAHAITPRFMQRLWATVFSTCPHMVYDDATNHWNVLWGHQELAASTIDAINKIADTGDVGEIHFLSRPARSEAE